MHSLSFLKKIMVNYHFEIYGNVQSTQFELTYKLFFTIKFLENNISVYNLFTL